MFDCAPSDSLKVYWKYTRRDIKVKLRLYLGAKQAELLSVYQAFALVAQQALGGGSSKSEPPAVVPQTADEMTRAFNSVFG